MKHNLKVTVEVDGKIVQVKTLTSFAARCKRTYQVINNATIKGRLNWGQIYQKDETGDKGLKLIIMDETAQNYYERCKAIDKTKKKKE